MRRTTVAIGGFTSNSGKTTLVCELLHAFPGWEAIKMTRGHYRSCGKDPHACCVSHLLGDEPLIRSGRDQTFTPGKDTGRYWEAGASNVHWAIVTDEQVEKGIKGVLELVRSPGVLIEGNSFLKFLDVDFTIMVAPARGTKIKPSARRALAKTSALYLSSGEDEALSTDDGSCLWKQQPDLREALASVPIYTRATLPELIMRIKSFHARN